jgi:transcriptional regulator with XRE-family HTH domain
MLNMRCENDKIVLKTLGLRIKELRVIRDISQEELASIADVHRTYIGMVERGEKNITILTLIKLCVALDANLTEILEDIKNGK